MKNFDLGNGIPTSAIPAVAAPKFFVSVILPVVTIGATHSIPRGIDTAAAGRPRFAERRELPVGIQSSTVSFDAASEPTNFATHEPISPV
jgi:hypothetical protein